MKLKLIFRFLMAIGGSFSSEVFAQAHKGINFQVQIADPNGQLVQASAVTVNLKILSPNNCVLKDENFANVDIVDGYINLNIGSGTLTGTDPHLSMTTIMNNSYNFGTLNCIQSDGSTTSGTYTSQNSDIRKVRAHLTLNSQVVEADFSMKAVAFAVNSETLNGKSDTDFVQISSNITQTKVESWFANAILGQILGGTYNAPTASTATTATTAATAGNVTGTVAIANGGTGATDAATARTNLGLGSMALMTPTGTASSSTYLRGDGQWTTVDAGVTSVAGRTGAITLTAADISGLTSGTLSSGTLGGNLIQLDSSGKIPAVDGSQIKNLDAGNITTGVIQRDVSSNSLAGTTGTFTNLNVYDATTHNNFAMTYTGAGYGIHWPTAIGSATQVLQIDSVSGGVATMAWAPIPSAPVSSVAGKTGAVTLANTDISGLGGAATLNVGTLAGTVAAGNDARLSDARIPTGAAGGDLAGTYPNPTFVPSGVSPATYGSSTSVPVLNVDVNGRITSASNAAIPTADTSTTGIISNTDWNTFNNKVPASGGTMTGTLNILPANGLSVGTNQFVLNSGNIGVGIATPASKLHIAADNTTTVNSGALSLGAAPFDGTSSGKFVGHANGTELAINAATGFAGNLMDLQVNGNSKFSIDKNGNVTAGTITATVAGVAANATNATNTTNVATTSVSNSASYYPLFVASSSNGNQAVNLGTGLTFNPSTNTITSATFSGALSGNATTATTATTATNATNTAITDDTTTASTVYPTWVTATTGNLPQKTSSSKMSFNPSTGVLTTTGYSGNLNGSNINSGSVGVNYGGTGATSAVQARSNLSAAASGANTDITSITNSIGAIAIAPTGALNLQPTTAVVSTQPYQAPAGSAAVPAFSYSSGTSTGMYFPSTTSLGLVTAGTARMNIDTSGNVGIGTTTPSAKLEVAGGIKLGNDTATCNAAKAGSFKWNGTYLYFCEGTAWKLVQLTTAAANVVQTGGTATGMNVTGPGSATLTYGSNVTFTFQNQGTGDTAAISVSLSNTTNFEFTGTDTCTGQVLAANASCSVTVRPKSTADGSLTGNLVVNW